jgi:tetratricopeptide (TPR) repeat protein
MRNPVLICLALLTITCCTCLGETAPAPAGTARLGRVGILCPTRNEEARQSYNSALLLQGQGKLREAEAAYQKAIELDPGFCDAMDNLGQMLRSEGDTKRAIGWYRRSLAVKPDNLVAHQNLAAAYRFQGELDKTREEYLWLVKHDADNPEGYYGLGMTYLDAGQTGAAIEPLERAESLYRAAASPLVSDARFLLGVAYYGEQKYQKARDYLAQAYPVMENDPNVNYLLGLCYLNPPIEDHAQARQYLLKAQKLGKELPANVKKKLEK